MCKPKKAKGSRLGARPRVAFRNTEAIIVGVSLPVLVF